jgi:MoxR-like ATPase
MTAEDIAVDDRRVTREEYIAAVASLIREGERLAEHPSLAAMRTWIAASDELLRQAWGDMDRYHLSWLMVGRPSDAIRGRAMTAAEEAAYVREVADAKTAALRMSRKAVEQDGMPFKGETR